MHLNTTFALPAQKTITVKNAITSLYRMLSGVYAGIIDNLALQSNQKNARVPGSLYIYICYPRAIDKNVLKRMKKGRSGHGCRGVRSPHFEKYYTHSDKVDLFI